MTNVEAAGEELVEPVQEAPVDESPATAEPNDPLPSRPVEGEVYDGVVESEGVEYLGTITMSVNGAVSGKATIPVVVRDLHTLAVVGVAVVSDPSLAGDRLLGLLDEAGYKGDCEVLRPSSLSLRSRAVVARAIAKQADPELDRRAALHSMGYQLEQFA